MRLSQATVKFLGRLSTTFERERGAAASLFVSEGCIYGRATSYGLVVTVIDSKSAPEWGTVVGGGFLTVLQGCGAEVELIVQEDRVEVASKGTSYNVSRSKEHEDAPLGFEGFDQSYKVDDPDTFTTALRDCLAGASKDGQKRLDVVIMDGGEMLATDGHRVVVRYTGVDGVARIPAPIAALWLKMLGSFDRSKGGWWVQMTADRVALVFRHFGQQVMLASCQAYTEEGCMTGPKLRRAIKANGPSEQGGAVDYDARAVRDFVKLFDVVAFYSNGAIAGWAKGSEKYDNHGNDGLLPRGEKPLFIASAPLLRGMLPKVSNKGYAAPLRLSFGDACKANDKNDGQRQTATFGDSVLMAWLDTVPEMAPDAYTAAAVEKAA